MRVELDWDGEQRFIATKEGLTLTIDGKGKVGPSPVVALALGLAGCMSVDVVHILDRMRTPADSLHVQLDIERADQDPRRLTAARLRFLVAGDVPDRNIARALELSRSTYCSVWHSLRQDIVLETEFEVRPPGVA